MKFFIALFALAAVAVAEPEADAEAGLYYSGLGYGYHGLGYNGLAHHGYALGHAAYTPYSFGYRAFSPYYNNYYGNAFGYSRLFKREAEAEADPAIFYNSHFAYGASPYAYGAGYTPFAYNHAFAYNHHLTTPYAYGLAHHAVAAAPTHVTQVSQGGISSTAAVHSGVRAFGGYANAGNYVANSAGVVHVAKREAEADPQFYYGGLYNYGTPYATTYAHRAYTPYAFAHRAYSPYYNGHFGYRNSFYNRYFF